MGRPERPLNPEDSPLARFAFDLRELRRAAGGISYREPAKRAHYSRTALSQAASGSELPTLPVTLAYVRACGGDTAAWEVRWRALAESGSARSAAAGSQLAAPRALPPWRRRLVWLVVPTVLGVGLVGARQMTNDHRHPIGPARLQAWAVHFSRPGTGSRYPSWRTGADRRAVRRAADTRSCQASFTITDADGREFFPGKGGLFVTVNVVA